MKLNILALLSIGIVAACSSENKSNDRTQTSIDAISEITEESSSAEEIKEKDKIYNIAPIPLSKNPATGAQFRLVSPTGLDEIYARVFKRQASGHFVYACPAYDIFECKDSFFTNPEAIAMGGSYLTRNIANFKQPDNLTLNYLRSLRAMLRRECTSLVRREWRSVAAEENAASNVLVTVPGVPPKEVFDGFLRRLLGINGLDVKVDTGAADYRKAFEQSLATFPEEVELDQNQYMNTYINTCIAISMDPRVIFY
jgi:hypothetical protein